MKEKSIELNNPILGATMIVAPIENIDYLRFNKYCIELIDDGTITTEWDYEEFIKDFSPLQVGDKNVWIKEEQDSKCFNEVLSVRVVKLDDIDMKDMIAMGIKIPCLSDLLIHLKAQGIDNAMELYENESYVLLLEITPIKDKT